MRFELRQGDCLELMRDLSPGSVDLILCDLPYGITACAWDSVIPFDRLWAEYRRVAKPNAAIVLTASQPFTTALIASNLREFRYCWVWSKGYPTGFVNANRMPMRAHEDIAVFYRALPTYNPQGVRECNRPSRNRRNAPKVMGPRALGKDFVQTRTGYPWTIISTKKEGRTVHPTQKPVALMEYLVRTYTNPGGLVLDNCMGSGTTGVACMNAGRRFIGMELDAGYFEFARARIAGAANDNEAPCSEAGAAAA